MSTLTWNDELTLHQPQIDQTHQEFIDLMNELSQNLQSCDSALPIYQRLLQHTEAHFAMEEGFMAATGFAPDNCHSKQHAMVLDVMRQVLVHTHAEQDLEPMRNLLPELASWLPSHVDMMDASLVFHMKQLGFDPETGLMTNPPPTAEAPISSCGSNSCA
ncbi:hemerythrin domain-containing protein [Paucibacter sp. AS339]|uniref:hemerythrin domain-containing protein n=1 Tax=Paucibacter hankyongi TaxID=3133434 RepID=UPI0030A06664